jgi:phospholipase C
MFVPKTVFTILLENHDYNEVVGSANAPYINSLIAQYGLATNYMDSGTHPSLPNYLYLISGATQYPGIVDLDPMTFLVFPVNADNLGNQLQGASIKWRSYQESMGTPCVLTSPAPAANGHTFACKHDPFLYFTNIQNGPNNLCATTNVDYSSFAADLAGGTYRYMWITPDLLDDGHDPNATPQDIITGLTDSDTWLSQNVPPILASAAFQQGGVLFITWDEAEGRNGDSGDQVPMIVVTPGIPHAGYTSNVAYTHANYLATVEDIFGLPRLGAAVGAASMKEFWGQ